jgi:uncharacterized membrane protein (DUF373 family)
MSESQQHEEQPAASDVVEPEEAAHSRQAEAVRRLVIPWLGGADTLVYGLVAIIFLLGALVMLGYSIWAFFAHIGEDFPLPVITLINDLLLVMIMMEVLRTVLSYIEEHGASLRPFLFIGAISATRRILAIGAETTISGEQVVSQEEFRRRMIDLGVNAAVIVAIAVALFLLTRRENR